MKLVADANVLLSAVLGGRARLVLNHPEIEAVFATEATFAEVEEYAAVLGRRKRLSLETLLLTVATLPVSIVDHEVYKNEVSQARKLLERRDPDDVELLALALHLKLPLWSNDNDFEECGIEWFTTAEVLQHLGISSRG